MPLTFRLAPILLLALLVAPVTADPSVRIERAIPYATHDGKTLHLDAYLPPGEGPFPAVLVIHGGSWRGGDRNQLTMHAWIFARAGIAAFAIDYRLAPAHRWPAQIHDCKEAVRWLRAHATDYHIDPQRIGAFGYSAGGHLAALLGVTDRSAGLEGPDAPEDADTRIQAVCAGGTPVEFRTLPPRSGTFRYWLGASPADDPELYRVVSPAAHISSEAPPFLFFHGTNDRMVSLKAVRRMSDDLQSQGVESRVYEALGTGHIATAVHPAAAWQARSFFLEHLTKREAAD